MTATPNSLSDLRRALAELTDYFGRDFVEWCIGSPIEPLPVQHKTVIDNLLDICDFMDPTHVLPPNILVGRLLAEDPTTGTTLLHRMRGIDSVDVNEFAVATDDRVLAALDVVAAVAFGELLIPRDYPGTPINSIMFSEHRDRLIDAVCSDPELPFGVGSKEEGSSVHIRASTGHGGGVQVVMAGSSILTAAADHAVANGRPLTMDSLRKSIPKVLKNARSAWAGNTATTLGTAALTGVALPDDCTLEFQWGSLRPARLEDHPSWLRRTYVGDEPPQESNGGRSTDRRGGAIILNAKVPFTLKSSEKFDLSDPWPDLVSRKDFDSRITQVRLALLLALGFQESPPIVPTWSKFVEPLAQGGGVSELEPQIPFGKSSKQLTPSEAQSWKDWISLLDRVGMKKLGVAPVRALRALVERRDSADSLVDAVIAWEALLGAKEGTTLRVCTAVAKLLKSSQPERIRLRGRAAEIYDTRSKVVHGQHVDADEVNAASREAIAIAVEAIQSLVADRQDLLRRSSAERSLYLLME